MVASSTTVAAGCEIDAGQTPAKRAKQGPTWAACLGRLCAPAIPRECDDLNTSFLLLLGALERAHPPFGLPVAALRPLADVALYQRCCGVVERCALCAEPTSPLEDYLMCLQEIRAGSGQQNSQRSQQMFLEQKSQQLQRQRGGESNSGSSDGITDDLDATLGPVLHEFLKRRQGADESASESESECEVESEAGPGPDFESESGRDTCVLGSCSERHGEEQPRVQPSLEDTGVAVERSGRQDAVARGNDEPDAIARLSSGLAMRSRDRTGGVDARKKEDTTTNGPPLGLRGRLMAGVDAVLAMAHNDMGLKGALGRLAARLLFAAHAGTNGDVMQGLIDARFAIAPPASLRKRSRKEVSSMLGEASVAARVEGSALFPTVALLNHSCTPNASVEFVSGDGTATLLAMKDLDRGEELSISYVPVTWSTAERQAALLKRYDFTCRCVACREPRAE